ncbi:MAG: hypothetical protein H7221_00455 [Flavobacterium sp.]|nr:hypothetical protein [Flavobacterium sp.]
MQKIKLIWDFKGQDAEKIAVHHEIHLKQFLQMEQLEASVTGFEIKNELHAIAFMIVDKDQMIAVRDALKPHRGELYG